VKGYLDKINAKDVTRFETEFLRKIKSAHSNILDSIRSEQKISDSVEAELKKIIIEFVEIFK
jgi:F0F1-type ATP synthase alpha subunit